MNLNAKIVRHKGQWCVKDFYKMSDKPEISINYWPIGRTDKYIDISQYENHEIEKSGNCYTYALRIAPYQWVYLYLTEAGKTKSIDTEIIPYPCPKVRKGIKTRYHYGIWEKLLKSGWVTA